MTSDTNDLATFILGLAAGGWAVWFYLRDRIKPKDKKFYRCPISRCEWKTSEAVPPTEGESLQKHHLEQAHKIVTSEETVL